MKYDAVIFDLGNTLVAYWRPEEWPQMLAEAVDAAAAWLRSRGIDRVSAGELPARVRAERGERDNCLVVPLADRLGRIFRLSPEDLAGGAAMELCRRFMGPLFRRGRLYDDALPTLAALRRRGLRTGILSNSPWGSPAALWREEVDRLGLLAAVDAAVFCGEVGWRKPAVQGFERIAEKLHVPPGRCLFVGDDARWDVAGPRRAGMAAIRIDRLAPSPTGDVEVVHDLGQLLDRLGE